MSQITTTSRTGLGARMPFGEFCASQAPNQALLHPPRRPSTKARAPTAQSTRTAGRVIARSDDTSATE